MPAICEQVSAICLQQLPISELLDERIPARVLLPTIVKCYNVLWDGSKVTWCY